MPTFALAGFLLAAFGLVAAVVIKIHKFVGAKFFDNPVKLHLPRR
jgi:hypothetical protein